MVLTYAITVLIVAAWAARMIVAGRLFFKRTYLDIPLLVFIISQLLAVIFSIHPYTSLLGYYSRFHGGLASVITYTLLFYAFVSNVEKKHLSAFFLSLTTSGILVSLYGILEHFGHSISCLTVSGGSNFGVDCWIQDVKNRVFATFGQPNWLAAYLITLLPLTTALALKKYRNQYINLFYVSATLLFFLTVIFTKSRSGFIGAACGMAVFGILIAWKLARKQQLATFLTTTKKYIILLKTGLLVIALLFGTVYTPSLASLLEKNSAEITQNQQQTPVPAPVVNRLDIGGTDSGEIRKIVWQGALDVWKRYPIFGSGLETFGYSYYQDRPVEHNMVSEWDFLYNKAHNEFLNFLATTGIVGLVSYLVLLGWFFYSAIKQINNTTETATTLVLAATVGSIVAVSVSNFFGFSTVMVAILMYLYFGLVEILASKETKTPETIRELSGTDYLLLSVVGLLYLFSVRMVYQYWSADVAYAHGKALLEAGYFDQGVEQLNTAIEKSPQEATFYDELATQYALYSLGFAQQGKNAEAQALMTAAIQVSDAVIKLNSRQLNFYKTRARVFITLAQMRPELLQNAKQSLEQALELAPTDPKLLYNLGLVEVSLDDTEHGISHLKKAIQLKPNYESARWQLALLLEEQNKPTEALEQLKYIQENIAPTNQQVADKIASLSAQDNTK